MNSSTYVDLFYLLAATLFILGLKGLSHPRTAVRGNLMGALGMLLAVVVTLLRQEILNIELLLAGLLAGTLVGALLAWKIKMTAMPQLVGLFNGFGGIASVLVAAAVIYQA
ncbi:MAG: NAD(P)(+) transhydrogenase (Re/Si-specific) subunit beta, partial [Alkalispirochaetaceae bacterium]